MITVRPSVPEDVPALRGLWKLAFGDSDAYLDNYFQTAYWPDHMLVLEEDGAVRSMAAWFDTNFCVPGRGMYWTAYLYAVATHPACRGRGFSGQLLAWADRFLRELGLSAVSTVPAEPSLHNFFGANGFRECFIHDQLVGWREEFPGTPPPPPSSLTLEPLEPGQYGGRREPLLQDIPHIIYPDYALAYQAGCCQLSGGGLYQVPTEQGSVLLCLERADNGTAVIKELLGPKEAREIFLKEMPALLHADVWEVRAPYRGGPLPGHRFGMLEWLDPARERACDWDAAGYLGLAFD